MAPYIECAFSNLDYPYQTIWIPSEYAQLVTEHGEYDGYFPASKNDQRDVNAELSAPFGNVEWLYVVRKDSVLTPVGSDFYSRTFAAILGSAQDSWQDDKFRKGEIVGVQGSAKSMTLLALGMTDVDLVDSVNIEAALEEANLNPADFQTFISSALPTGIYFGKAFLKGSPELFSEFNASMKSCKNV